VVKRPYLFPYENQFCMGLLYGRAGRLTAEKGGFWPGQSVIRWRGPEAPDNLMASPVGKYSMVWDHGAGYFNYKGLVWDGSGTAAVGVDHFSRQFFSTFMLHRLEAFLNFKVAGVRVGGQQVNSP
jgi:hypothetical protein